jgi:hypothetical protein
MARPNVNELDIHAIDGRDEFRQCVQFLLRLAPVIVGSPVPNQVLNSFKLNALRDICDSLLVGPTRVGDAATQVVEL